MIFWCNRQNFGPKSGGGVYHVIIGISDFGPKQGGVFGMKGTVFKRKGAWGDSVVSLVSCYISLCLPCVIHSVISGRR